MSSKRYFGISTRRDRQPIVWKRFSIRFLFVLTAAAALGMAYWRAHTYRHPAHAVMSYEKAPYTSSRKMKVGPNEISIRSIARNRYDGTIDVIKGDGLRTNIPQANQLKQAAKWLDLVQLEIEPVPERVEILEARVFDHQSRALLWQVDAAYGWQVAEPNLVQVYGFGKEIPDKLDIWLRVQSHPSQDVYRLPPKAGAKVQLPKGTVAVKDLQAGMQGWSSATGFTQPSPNAADGCGILLDWKGAWSDEGKFQFGAVSRDGVREYEDTYLDLSRSSQAAAPARFHIPLEDVDHLVLRPDGGRHAFFFDGLEIPPSQTRPFDPLPAASIVVDGQEVDGTLKQFEPLTIRYRTRMGNHVYPIRPDEPAGAFSLFLIMPGQGNYFPNTKVAIKPDDTGGSPSWFRGNSQSISTSSTGMRTFSGVYWQPLDEVRRIEVSLPAP